MGFPLKEGLGKHCPGVSLHARRIILGPELSLVSARLDEIDDKLDWDAVPAQVLRIHLWPRMHLVLGPARNR